MLGTNTEPASYHLPANNGPIILAAWRLAGKTATTDSIWIVRCTIRLRGRFTWYGGGRVTRSSHNANPLKNQCLRDVCLWVVCVNMDLMSFFFFFFFDFLIFDYVFRTAIYYSFWFEILKNSLFYESLFIVFEIFFILRTIFIKIYLQWLYSLDFYVLNCEKIVGLIK